MTLTLVAEPVPELPDYCGERDAKVPTDVLLTHADITSERFDIALKSLSEVPSIVDGAFEGGAEFSPFASDLSNIYYNSLVVIEGYALRMRAEKSMAEGDLSGIEPYCEFLTTSAVD